jgi:hypothetical protein
MTMEIALLFAQVGETNRIDDSFNWPLAFFMVGTMAAICLVVSIAVWQGLITWRSRMSIAREEAYRALTQDLARFQSRIADSLERSNSELVELRQRTAEMERLLKEVG